MEVDVIIVGAGLAGVSAAAEIASRSRASIVVVERRVIGSNNPTPMTFSDVPQRFGLEDSIIGCYDRFTFHSPLGNRSSHRFEDVQLVALAYQKASLTLLNRASSAGNVWLYSAAAIGLERQGKGGRAGWQMRLNDGRELRAPLVIDASGRGLFSSRVLDLPRPKSFSHCYGARLSGSQVPDPREAFFFAPTEAYGSGGGWLYPLNDGQVSVGYATLSDQPGFPGGAVKTNFRRFLAEFEPYTGWLREARWEYVEAGTIPLYPLRRLVYDGLLITGDAAGQATLWSCMGSEAALEAGQLAGDAAVVALLNGDFSARRLSKYQKNWDARHRRTYQRNAWVAPVVWGQTEKDWNQVIPRVQELHAPQMLARLRVNWPVPSIPQALFVRAYDLAGRIRRGLARRLRRTRLRRPEPAGEQNPQRNPTPDV